MHHLYDFGISQEDPLTELAVLDIRNNDHLLCIASGGEVPLSILCLQPGVKITAVDVSNTQLVLCRLKMQAAGLLPFPLNGQFLGYALLSPKTRREIYFDTLHASLEKEDREFWIQHLAAIETGVVNNGRFEGYIKKLRKIAAVLIGKNNIRELLACPGTGEQQLVFDKKIASRNALRYLFRMAFHPAVYKNRGLSAKGLMHAQANTGQVFFNKFRNFCTATPVTKNYFLHYFLTGDCAAEEAFPEYLQARSRSALVANKERLCFKLSSLQDELAANPAGTFSKIHLSNIGDWMSKEEFNALLGMVCASGNEETRLCYRFLQKNHIDTDQICNNRFAVTAVDCVRTDRFPFYTILSIQGHG